MVRAGGSACEDLMVSFLPSFKRRCRKKEKLSYVGASTACQKQRCRKTFGPFDCWDVNSSCLLILLALFGAAGFDMIWVSPRRMFDDDGRAED